MVDTVERASVNPIFFPVLFLLIVERHNVFPLDEREYFSCTPSNCWELKSTFCIWLRFKDSKWLKLRWSNRTTQYTISSMKIPLWSGLWWMILVYLLSYVGNCKKSGVLPGTVLCFERRHVARDMRYFFFVLLTKYMSIVIVQLPFFSYFFKWW